MVTDFTRSAAAASRTVRSSLGSIQPERPCRDCNPGVTRGGQTPAKSSKGFPFGPVPFPVVPGTCEVLPPADRPFACLSRRRPRVRVPYTPPLRPRAPQETQGDPGSSFPYSKRRSVGGRCAQVPWAGSAPALATDATGTVRSSGPVRSPQSDAISAMERLLAPTAPQEISSTGPYAAFSELVVASSKGPRTWGRSGPAHTPPSDQQPITALTA